MCGIIGYIGDRSATQILINGLKRLEYRGYDSAGICTLQNGELTTIKVKGRVSELEKRNLDELNGNIGIAHTRWATHGEPNEINAHPHYDCKKEIAIVHNGIIENYRDLKEKLETDGHIFKSETDSEVISHLIEKYYELYDDIEEAMKRSLKDVEGAYGIAVMQKKENKILVARKGSPLIIGIGNNEMFVASDVPAILSRTKKIVYLDDNQIAVVSSNGYKITSIDGESGTNKIQDINWNLDEIEKKGYKHFMLKEIFEQPESITNLLRGRVRDNQIKITTNIDFRNIKKIHLVACGTSYYSSLLGREIIEKYCRIPVEVTYGSEFRYRNPIIADGELVIGISQSGETADTLAAVKEAKEKGAKTFGIVNVVGSSIAREVGSGIYLRAGPEIAVASTKAFTSQVIALFLLALYIQQEQGNEISKKLISEISNIPEKIKLVLENSGNIRKIAEKIKDSKSALYLGRGINYPVALEGALKLKEISYIFAEGYPAGEMKHGHIALIEKDFPVVVICPKNNVYDKTLSNMEEVKARSGWLIAVTDSEDEKIRKITEDIIIIPQTEKELSPILSTVALQLLAYHISDLKGINVDKPRNLAKSVTVE